MERQIFETRITDHGDGTGVVEYQLDGSGVASVACTIVKRAWTQPAVSGTGTGFPSEAGPDTVSEGNG